MNATLKQKKTYKILFWLNDNFLRFCHSVYFGLYGVMDYSAWASQAALKPVLLIFHKSFYNRWVWPLQSQLL